MVMRGSCTSFAMLDGASKDRNPKRNKMSEEKELGTVIQQLLRCLRGVALVVVVQRIRTTSACGWLL